MATVSAFAAKTRFGELLERVARGEEIVITRHDKPVARIVPEGAQRLADVRRAIEGLRDLQVLAPAEGVRRGHPGRRARHACPIQRLSSAVHAISLDQFRICSENAMQNPIPNQG